MRTDTLPSLSRLIPFVWLIGGALCISALVPLAIQQHGLDNPEPIQAYLNGNLPSQTPASGTSWDNVAAFPNLKFAGITVFAAEPASNRLYAGQRDGLIHFFENDSLATGKTVFLDLRSQVAETDEGGLLGFAFHPKFHLDSNYVYLYYCARLPNASIPFVLSDGVWPAHPWGYPGIYYNTWGRLSRFTVDPNTHVADPNSELIMINKRVYNSSHCGGGLAFDNAGYLFLALGDEVRYETAQVIDTLLEGGVLRMDVDRDPSRSHAPIQTLPLGNSDEYSGIGYWIPNDNPFLDPTGNQFEEYYAIGLRNPLKMTYDAVTDRMWIGDVGEGNREEVNVLEKGANYGWPYWEGTQPYAGPATIPTLLGTLKQPTADFPHSEIGCIIGGYVYRGNQNPGLIGKYICGDYNFQELWALTYDPVTGLSTKTQMGYFSPGLLTSFGQDQSGEVFLLSLNDSVRIHKFVPLNSSPDAPALLSQTGAFSDLATLTPTDGVIPYGLNQPFWSDGAEKFRWMAIPNNGTHNAANEKIAYSATGEWQLPIGAVLIKHFEYPIDDTNPSVTRRLETRFLVHGADDVYYGLTYRWRPDGLEADLLTGSALDTLSIATPTATREVIWQYPGRNECRICHNDVAGNVLGPNTRQFNKEILYPKTGRIANQLTTLAHLGIFDTSIDTTAAGLDALLTSSPITDVSLPVEDRALTYLDANCSYCHRPGNALRANLDVRLSTPLANTGLINGSLQTTLGLLNESVVSPGDTSASVLYQRMHSINSAIMMPPLAKRKIDEAGAAVIAEWILSLSPAVAFPVELLGFEAMLEGDQVLITWETASEQNSAHFVVERSQDGADFEELLQVGAAGTSSEIRNYVAQDPRPLRGESYYRLRAVDLDGTVAYSMIRSVVLSGNLIRLFPNPLNSDKGLYVELDFDAALPVYVWILDVRGHVVLRHEIQMSASRHQERISLEALSAGVYFMTVGSGGQQWVKKVIVP